MSSRRLTAQARRRLGSEAGFTLPELLVVLTIMSIVLAPLVGSFTAALAAQVDQVSRFEAQESARLALDRMRKDIRCAHGVTPPVENASGGVTIAFTQTNLTGTAECPGLIKVGASAVQWCTVPVDEETEHFRLFRESDADITCDGTHSDFQVDYVTTAGLWTIPTCVATSYPAVLVALPVNTDPVGHPDRSYTLDDRIALRNADPCA